jgi:hypothetical protein
LCADHLHCSRRDIVRGSITEDIVQCLLLGNIPTGLANNQAQLGFIVTSIILGTFGDINSSGIGTGEGSARLGEKDGRFRKREVAFFGMVHVVQTQAADIAALFLCHWG